MEESFMRLALAEAARGLGRTRPNPAVGALVVKDGRVVAKGRHAQAGGPHAEVVALRAAGERARGADLYITLEPCNHHGKTPPCTEAILNAGIARVFVGCRDANPLVRGRGIRRLRAAGLPVTLGVLEEACLALNAPFFKFITRKRPYVTLKIAATLDGKIATTSGDSRWVTGPKARARVHALRARVDAILVGAGTVRADDPRLTARAGGREGARQPLRVVLSRDLRLSPSAHVFTGPGNALVLTSERAAARSAGTESRSGEPGEGPVQGGHGGPPLRSRGGVEIMALPSDGHGVSLPAALDALAARDVMHLLVEGGAELFGAFLEQDLADELLLFLSPKVLGQGLTFAKLAARARMEDALALGDTTIERVGRDWLLRADLSKRPR